MNKYTLKFNDSQMEKKYELFKINALQFPTLTYISVGGTLLLAANIVVHLLNENYTNALQNGAVLCLLLFQYIVLKKYLKYRKHCNKALMLINFSFIIFEIDRPNNSDEQFFDGYLLGSNQMLVHTILMFANNLSSGVLSNILLTIARILIVNYKQNQLSAQQYIYTILVSFSFLFIQYENERQYRFSFSSSLRESRWEKMTPLFLKKPYLLFTFDQESNNYQILNSYKPEYFESETPLTNFLYQSTIPQGMSLSNYIQKLSKEAESVNDSACLYNHYIDVEYQQKKIIISFLAWQFEKIFYAIIIESEDPLIKEQQEKFQSQVKQFKEFLTLQIMPINKVLGAYLQETFHPLLRNLRVSLIEIFYQQQAFKNELQLVAIKKLLTKCAKLFQSPTNSITIVCDESLKFATLKHTLIIFIFEIFKTITINQSIYIEISQNQRIAIQIAGLRQLPQSDLFHDSKEVLIDKVIRYQDSLIFLLVKSPQITFTSHKGPQIFE